MSKTFSFPRFNITGNADNDRFSVDIGTLGFNGDEYVLHMMISTSAPAHATHSVATVERAGKRVWSHDRQKDAGLYTRLTLVNDEPVIAYVDMKTGHVLRTHPFSLFGQPFPLPVKKVVAYKRGAAEFLGIEAIFTEAEQSFRKVDPVEKKTEAEAKAKRAAEQTAREAEAEAQRKAREAKREAVRKAVAGREEVLVHTNHGIKRGQPVLQGEIPQLEPKRFYVLVESITDGVPTGPLKAFKAIAVKGKGIIMADGGYTATDFFDDTLVAPEPISSDNFKIGDGEPEDTVFSVAIYADKAAIDTLMKIGVDTVEFAAFPAGNNGQFRVFVLNGMDGATRAIEVGLLKPYTGEGDKSQVA